MAKKALDCNVEGANINNGRTERVQDANQPSELATLRLTARTKPKKSKGDFGLPTRSRAWCLRALCCRPWRRSLDGSKPHSGRRSRERRANFLVQRYPEAPAESVSRATKSAEVHEGRCSHHGKEGEYHREGEVRERIDRTAGEQLVARERTRRRIKTLKLIRVAGSTSVQDATINWNARRDARPLATRVLRRSSSRWPVSPPRSSSSRRFGFAGSASRPASVGRWRRMGPDFDVAHSFRCRSYRNLLWCVRRRVTRWL